MARNSGLGGDLKRTSRLQVPIRHRIRDRLRTIAFWSAVGLPLLYVPILIGGLSIAPDVFLALLGGHVLALIGGRNH